MEKPKKKSGSSYRMTSFHRKISDIYEHFQVEATS